VNGDLVPHDAQEEFMLADNDSIAIMPPLKGG